MERRDLLKKTGILTGSLLLGKLPAVASAGYPVVRATNRKFISTEVESAIAAFKRNVKDRELCWLFENCFPNTLDTTVTFTHIDGKPDTYVITGDIDAMWLRDSSAQVWPYLKLMGGDPHLQQLIAGVINRQTKCILKDPYANAFYRDPDKVGEWAHDLTKMQPGIHERKWEIDSLCYPIRLAYHYWKITKDTTPFDADWKNGIALTLKTFKDQQRKNGDGPYSFQRNTSWATDGVPLNGFGYPVKPNGLICSAFRPSDDATIFMYLVPSNYFAVVSLKQAAEMVRNIYKDEVLATELTGLADEVHAALKNNAVIAHPQYGNIYAYEVNGYGSYNLMDDANVPSLLGLPYLDAPVDEAVYENTRKLLLSANNPFFYNGTAGEGIGGPHAGKDMIWPLGITIRALTATDTTEIKHCIKMLKASNAGTGFMHESFHKNDVNNYTRKWFAWANTLFGELLWNVYHTQPELLNSFTNNK